VTDDSIAELNSAFADRYVVERILGAGGMATVYLAHDLKHDRRVAIKVLLPELSASIGATRFLQEVRIAAQLQHPHILGLIDSGQVGDTLFYVMPFVDGASLREQLGDGRALPRAEALRILLNVADGLSYAHARGLVHRDIKPENIMVSGRHALIADFGIAKALETAEYGRLTTVGLTLGTPAYMAPEQAAAEPDIDHRADLYAFGVVAYELLSGKPPFSGLTHQQVISAHITRDPEPLSVANPAIDPMLARIVMHCLQKDPADRYQSADAVYAALETLDSVSGEQPGHAAVMRRRTVARVAGAAVAIAAVVGAILVYRRQHVSAAPLVIGTARQVTTDDGLEIQPTISPDGRFVAYAAGNSQRMRIYIRPVAGGRTIALSDDSSSVEIQPRWSPSGDSLLFLSRNGAYVSPALGGSERLVAAGDAGEGVVRSASWAPDGRSVAIVRHDSLFIQALDGSGRRPLGRGTSLHSCTWSADARWIACVTGNPFALVPGYEFGNLAPSGIVLFPAGSGAAVAVTDVSHVYQSPQWSANSAMLYVVSNRDGPRDVYSINVGSDGHADGAMQRVTTGLNPQSISLSGDATQLAYSVYTAKANIWAAPVATGNALSTGDATPMTSGSQVIEVLSSRGSWILFDSDLSGSSEIYRLAIAGGAAERLTHDSLTKFAPELSPDGREVVYHAFGPEGHRQLYVLDLAANTTRRVLDFSGQASTPHWSPSGSAVVAWDQSTRNGEVFTLRRNSAGQWDKNVRLLAQGTVPVWSRDGQTIAFANRDGSIHAISPDSGPVRTLYAPVATRGDPVAQTLLWSADPNVIYFKGRDGARRGGIWSLRLGDDVPRLLLRLDDPSRPSDRPDFATDGRRFFFTIDDRQSDVWIARLRTP
jgi:Tol biopolymer transport system component/tRNA A-37 threonylcarbamoyl transferase component Bud32